MVKHLQLWSVCKNTNEYKNRDPNAEWKPDCSCGCIWFHRLQGQEGNDWGVCVNSNSERSGLLTFEHMGCNFFEKEVK